MPRNRPDSPWSREEPAFIALGKQKKTLRKERKAILEKASGEACLSLFGKELPDGVLHSCCFNESLWAFGLDEVLDAWDIMETSEYALMAERPWFTVNLESLRKPFAGREKVGVEGGPCLFGTDELHFSFTMKDGSVYHLLRATYSRSDPADFDPEYPYLTDDCFMLQVLDYPPKTKIKIYTPEKLKLSKTDQDSFYLALEKVYIGVFPQNSIEGDDLRQLVEDLTNK